ncbi:MAG: NUDIX hydrolase [Lachnospiraceae bacterium]|nr:NUDIX hydrolase [Lachnospiraceae bacterium]
MDKENLMWHTDSEETVFRTPVFAVKKKMQTAEAGPTGAYYSVSGSRCVCVVALYEGKLVMVRQFRHGSDRITSELPGGIVDAGETPEEAAGRELEEESGFRTGKVTLLGQMNPNPALFEKNSMLYVCLAEDLVPTGELHPDADEVLRSELVPLDEVIAEMGTGEYTHMFLGTALLFYLRYRKCIGSI